MKKIIMKLVPILLVCCLLISNFSLAADEIKQKENSNVSISTPSKKDEEQEIKMPQEKIIETKKEERIISKKNNGILTIATPTTNFKYEELSDGTLSITGYTGNEETVTIPSKINNKTVSEIGSNAFRDNWDILEVTIPSTVKTIGMGAFAYTYLKIVNLNSGLETIENNAFRESRIYSINIPNTVKKIEDYAFYYNEIGGKLVIPDSVEKIGNYAFAKNYGLKSISLGKNLSSLGNYAFGENSIIESCTVNSSNKYFTVESNVLFNKGKTELILYPSNKTDSSYTIPNTVKKIKTASFYGNENIKTVKISNSVTEIETGAFVKCTNLANITLGTGLKTIKDYAFNDVGITSIDIPAGVTSLNSIAFIGSTKLNAINVDSKNTVYTSVNGVVFTKDKTKLLMYPRGKTEESYNIPNTVKTIGESAFIDAKITSIVIPSSVKTLEDWCFGRATLTSVTLPNNITSIGNGPFDGCKELKSATINANIKTLPYRMFAENTSLSDVKLNDNIEVIDSRAFYNCTGLKAITLPKNLKKIEVGFLGCKNLAKVIIPSKVEWISSSSFESNTVIDISQTKLTKLDNGTYAIIYDVYLTGTFYYDKAKEVLNQLNQYRKQQGKSELKMDQDLFKAAMERAKEIALYFDHTRPSGMSCYTACSKMDAENIAAGDSTASGTMDQWKNSKEGHNENMLNKNWKSVGIGCYYTNGTYYWVQCFSANAGVEQTKIPANKTEKQKIQTQDDKIDIYYRDSKNISLAKGKNTTVGKIYTGNKGWEYPLILLEPESFKWTSGNSKVATVSTKGEIKAVDYGSTTVKGSIGNKEIIFNVSIKLPFTDVKETDYYYGSVAYTYENKIIKGKSDTIFAPRANITRGELVTILYRMEGTPKIGNKNPFTDVKEGTFYYNGVIWASEKGIVSGYGNGKFGANDPIKRAQLATILYNYAKYKKVDLSKKSDITTYKDYTTVKNKTIYALDSLKWAIGNKIMKGTDEGNINPTAYATRGQVAVMITNYCTKVKK